MTMAAALCSPWVVWRHGMNVHSSCSRSSRVNEARPVNGVLSSGSSKLGLRRRCRYNNNDDDGMELVLERSSLIGDVFDGKADRGSFAVRSSVAMVPVEEQKFAVSPGQALPLGPSLAERGINFALFSEHATSISLCM